MPAPVRQGVRSNSSKRWLFVPWSVYGLLLVGGGVALVASQRGAPPLVTAGVLAVAAGLAGLRATQLRRADARDLRASAERARELDAAAQQAERRYRSLFERTPAGIYRSTSDGHLLECNPALAHLLGYASPAELLSHSAAELYFDPGERERGLEQLRAQRQLTDHELRLKRKDGRPVWLLANVVLEPGVSGGPDLIVGSMVDITDRKLAQSRIEFQAYHDSLTHLPNRGLFIDRLALAIPRATRRHAGLAVLLMDLDRFKLVNDTFGHGAGDRLLQQVAERLRRSVREGDTVARLGGDEFSLLLESDVHAPQAAKVAEKLLARLADPFDLDGRRLHLTGSIGISLFPADGNDPETLLKSADVAMYCAKELGRNGYQLSTPELNARARERLGLENELRLALEREELVVHYQPMVSCANDQTIGLEALVRWRHPRNGLIGPLQFIPLAEEIRLEIPISEWVLGTACRQLRAWQQTVPPLRLAVNLSALHFERDDLPRRIGALLEAAGFPPELFEIEITESAAMKNRERTASTLGQLRDLGVRISLDDFGTGQASLSYLKHFPLDALKIDRAFVDDIGTGTGPDAIVAATIDLAHGLGLSAIAEGVETEHQLDFLKRRGCDIYQGFLYSPPADPAAISERLQRRLRVSA